ncbi:MAG TPA: hypothetical protein VFO78_10745 [Candidatus Limnocylindrales bacterium]|nr:hypothetical protein [Candidatus Limnocylindrales bacterium]
MDPTPVRPATRPDARAALRSALAPGEKVTHLVPAIGCILALTTERLIVAREGSAFRPKTGVRRWDLDERLSMRAGLVRHGTGTLAILWDRDATSVFVRAEHWDAALELVGAVRVSVRRATAGRR